MITYFNLFLGAKSWKKNPSDFFWGVMWWQNGAPLKKTLIQPHFCRVLPPPFPSTSNGLEKEEGRKGRGCNHFTTILRKIRERKRECRVHPARFSGKTGNSDTSLFLRVSNSWGKTGQVSKNPVFSTNVLIPGLPFSPVFVSWNTHPPTPGKSWIIFEVFYSTFRLFEYSGIEAFGRIRINL